MASLWQRFVRYWNMNRISKLKKHFDAISEETRPGSQADKEEVAFFTKRCGTLYKEGMTYVHIRFFFYLILYGGLGALPILKNIENSPLPSFILSTTFAFIAVLFLSLKINMIAMKMQNSLTHLIAIYAKNGKRNAKKVIRELENMF